MDPPDEAVDRKSPSSSLSTLASPPAALALIIGVLELQNHLHPAVNALSLLIGSFDSSRQAAIPAIYFNIACSATYPLPSGLPLAHPLSPSSPRIIIAVLRAAMAITAIVRSSLVSHFAVSSSPATARRSSYALMRSMTRATGESDFFKAWDTPCDHPLCRWFSYMSRPPSPSDAVFSIQCRARPSVVGLWL